MENISTWENKVFPISLLVSLLFFLFCLSFLAFSQPRFSVLQFKSCPSTLVFRGLGEMS